MNDRRRGGLALLLYLLLSCSTSPAAAQEPPPSSEPLAEEETVKREETVDVEAELPALPPSAGVATRLPVSVKDLPLTLSVTPASLLREQSAFVLGDALQNASGVNVATGFGVFDYFVVRGVDSLTGGLVLTDGGAEPESTYYPTYNVHQVEVLKGPSSFLYGGNALAGAVLMKRKQPLQARFVEGSFTYGRFGTYAATADANFATSGGKIAARLNSTLQGTEQYRDLDKGDIDAIHPTVIYRPGPDTRLLFSYEYVKSDWSPDTGLPFVGESGSALADVPRTRSFQSPFDFSSQDVHRVRQDTDYKLSDRQTLRNRFYLTHLGWNSIGTLVSGTFDLPTPDGGARTQVLRVLTVLDDSQLLQGNQLELSTSFNTGSLAHEMVVGVEETYFTDQFVQGVALLPPMDLQDPVEFSGATPPPPSPALGGLAGDARALVFAPYVVDRMTFGKRWQAFVGARYDILDYEEAISGTSRNETHLSPLLGVSFTPTREVTVYASGGTSFAPPSTLVTGPRESEEGRQLEVGAKAQILGGKAFVGGSFYALRRDNIAIPDATGLLGQNGDQRSRGFEVDFTGQPTKGFWTYASYAFTDSVYDDFANLVQTPGGIFVLDHSGNRAPFAPRHLLNVWLSKELPYGFAVAAGLRALSSQYVGDDNRYTIDSYATLDGAVSYRRGRLRLAVNFKNITGTEYATRGFGGLSAIPARPFEALARVDLRLGSR